MDKMKSLKMCIDNDLHGHYELEEHDDLEGFIIYDSRPDNLGNPRFALYSIYCAPGGYSAYECQQDITNGGFDEIAICENVPLFTAVSSLYTKHKAWEPEAYPWITKPRGGLWNPGW